MHAIHNGVRQSLVETDDPTGCYHTTRTNITPSIHARVTCGYACNEILEGATASTVTGEQARILFETQQRVEEAGLATANKPEEFRFVYFCRCAVTPAAEVAS